MKVFLFTFLIVVFFGAPALAASKIYWGYVSTGPGMGVLGHGFLLYRNLSEPFLMGDVYQYNIDIDLDRVTFVIQKEKFYEFLLAYTGQEDRGVRLYELKLSATEQNHLIALLDADLKNPHFAEQFRYSSEQNCISRPIQLLNSVVTPDRRIAYLGKNGAYSKSQNPFKMLAEPLLNRFPFYIAQTLENHPISAGLVKTYESESARQAKFLASALRSVHQMALLCHWSSTTQSALSLFFSYYAKSAKPLSLKGVEDLAKSCPASRAPFLSALTSLYQTVNPQSIGQRKEIYLRASELLQ